MLPPLVPEFPAPTAAEPPARGEGGRRTRPERVLGSSGKRVKLAVRDRELPLRELPLPGREAGREPPGERPTATAEAAQAPTGERSAEQPGRPATQAAAEGEDAEPEVEGPGGSSPRRIMPTCNRLPELGLDEGANPTRLVCEFDGLFFCSLAAMQEAAAAGEPSSGSRVMLCFRWPLPGRTAPNSPEVLGLKASPQRADAIGELQVGADCAQQNGDAPRED
mmetsp:Transcript_140153/g.349280  ORF Transcript_140153/g.349280 Transcript_140153/m.349280 type:complete len:222 (+) Transcript_140153:1285-1950(+)